MRCVCRVDARRPVDSPALRGHQPARVHPQRVARAALSLDRRQRRIWHAMRPRNAASSRARRARSAAVLRRAERGNPVGLTHPCALGRRASKREREKSRFAGFTLPHLRRRASYAAEKRSPLSRDFHVDLPLSRERERERRRFNFAIMRARHTLLRHAARATHRCRDVW